MKVKATYRLDSELLDKIHSAAEEEGRTHTWYVSTALNRYFDKPTGIVSEKKPVVKKSVAVVVDDNGMADVLITCLNMHAGTNYRHTDNNRKLINARLKDYSYDDVCGVIKKKCAEWNGGSMAKYLRPSTLFNATKFEEYLNQKITGGNHETNRPKQHTKETALERMEREQAAMDLRRETPKNHGEVFSEDGTVVSTQVHIGGRGAY